MVVRPIPAPQHMGEEEPCACMKSPPCIKKKTIRTTAELSDKINVSGSKTPQRYLTTLCNLYTGQPKFTYDFGSNSSAIFGYLSVYLYLPASPLYSAFPYLWQCLHSSFIINGDCGTSAARCPLGWPPSRERGIEQRGGCGLGEGGGVGTACR